MNLHFKYKLSSIKLGLTLIFIIGSSVLLKGQTIPVGGALDVQTRFGQLFGDKTSFSATIRPIGIQVLDSNQQEIIKPLLPTVLYKSNFLKNTQISVLPISGVLSYNSHHPFGFNNGPIIPAKGLQTYLSAGLNVKLGPLEVQLNPEWVNAENPYFPSYSEGRTDLEKINYFKFYNYIDFPERFGDGKYNKIFPGQSFVKLNFGPVSVGYSTENLWWGPGVQNSLIMGNDAPGFQHLTIHTNKPIKTGIGSFEAQLIGGRLESSKEPALQNSIVSTGHDLNPTFIGSWRYLSALNINYQPKWVPNLYLGFTRSFMAYESELNGFKDYFPLFIRFQKFDVDQDNFDRDQRLSFYTRWVFPKSNAEVYFEFGLNDNSYNFRDFIGSPDHSRAYQFGFSKLLPLNAHKKYISFNAEITQLSQTVDRLVRDAGGFYQHFQVRQGYTHYGQNLGSGPGSGSNVAGLQVNFHKGLSNVGLKFQRIDRNVDFYEYFINDLNQQSRKWVDFALGLNGQAAYKNLLFKVDITGVKSLNYQWRLKDYDPNAAYYTPKNDVFNFHGTLGLMYRF
ncbi:capsule assembly Wzi family protein [Pedobacter flavus]|uniref:Capsule assembly Wzi family protein n=1 Tax=Pedobacter flavus TaxID=3113906 RepID=A0ABU7H074_9SPHI|nr:capsule assembly Wzi family protein [Pedobacter sp. VNH31]MEE1884726.1 capsule assembly Wzi family protein [Pedobacter sp. VNH31]